MLKCTSASLRSATRSGFSTLQRVEIAEISKCRAQNQVIGSFSTLQRVEIAEIQEEAWTSHGRASFSTLQRVEIAEIRHGCHECHERHEVSVLFNESKLLKYARQETMFPDETVSVLFNESKLLKSAPIAAGPQPCWSFSTLQRVEIAEIRPVNTPATAPTRVSVLFNESKLLKLFVYETGNYDTNNVSVLFNESKLLKSTATHCSLTSPRQFQYSSTSRNC